MRGLEEAATALEAALTDLVEACESRSSSGTALERRAARVETAFARLAVARDDAGAEAGLDHAPILARCLRLHALLRASAIMRRDETRNSIESTRAVRRNLALLNASEGRAHTMDRRG